MSDDFGKKSQYEYLYAALQDKYPGIASGDGSYVFQFSETPLEASWITGTDINAYGIANAVSVDLGGFYVPGDALDSSYSTLLKSIKPKNGDDNKDYLKKQQELGDLRNQQQVISDKARKDYYVWAANNSKSDGTPQETFSEWLNDPFGGQYVGGQMNDLQAKVVEINDEIAKILKSLDAGLSDAINNLSKDTMPISRGGAAIQVPAITINGDLAKDKVRWDQYSNNEYDFDVRINKDSVIKSPWKTVYDTKVHHDCFSTSVSVNINTSRIITDAHYELRFTAVGLQAYQISRGTWYNASFVNPNVEIVQGAVGVTNDSFFGVSGSLHLIPESILVMYKPVIQLTVSTEVYKQQFETNADADIDWVDLFGFRFSIDGIASLKPVENGNNTTTITFSSPSNASPQIIGVTSKVEYNGQG
ncbi:hypothetical protein DFP93_106177 [Aneurinibacillus soli]|uniref:Uncharacterized protein n=1 Tax=Aneurinibacillus soli TaxID=1500254 RepID=A0A0U5B1D8_9BACL|nr:hypothetical protein [Aneurinibacillus soli]PYE61982.1 hypothetical protein DFP93_106177 [Aneurinibacillus soli]BAU29797.1 hypothetical protein CB4_04034 [Aneurinibacillus soli]